MKRLLSEDKLEQRRREKIRKKDSSEPEPPLKKQSSLALHAAKMLRQTTLKRQETIVNNGKVTPMMKSQMSPLMRGVSIREVQKDNFSEAGAGESFEA